MTLGSEAEREQCEVHREVGHVSCYRYCSSGDIGLGLGGVRRPMGRVGWIMGSNGMPPSTII